MTNAEIEINNNNLIILVGFCRSLARANLQNDNYLSSELWLRLARELESQIVE